jgi:hypothetical protein
MIKGTIEGLDIVVHGLESVGPDTRKAAYYAVVEVLQMAFKVCQDTITLQDHSLRSLALLGHPYGFKHPAEIHSPDVLIHEQGGRYAAALKATPPVGLAYDIIEGSIGIDPASGQQELDRWLQEGTSKMRARPWMQYIVDQYGAAWADLIIARIEESLERYAA